jgi:hypothetical protein
LSTGYLIKEIADQVTVAAHIADHDDAENTQVAGMMVIPKGAIISFQEPTTSGRVCEVAGQRITFPVL